MTLLLDAGAFIAAERRDRDFVALIKRERLAGRAPLTHGGIVGQVWRGGAGRQAPVALLLEGMEVAPIDDELGRRCGVLLRSTKSRDVIDAALVLLARDGDVILTSDPEDLQLLAETVGVHVDIVRVR